MTKTLTKFVYFPDAFRTIHDYIVGYAGCDTYVVYRCTEFGGK